MQKYKLFGEVSGLPFFLLWQPCQYHLLALILSIFWFYRTAIEKNTKLQQEQNATNEAVQEWFNEQIVYFESDIQLALRNCAKLFVQTGKIEIEQEKIPPCDTRYKHTDFLRICAIFLLAGRSRVQCANFTNTVFHSYFHGTTLKSIHRKLWGKEKMRKILLECQQSK